MTEYRITKDKLWDTLEAWDSYISGKVRLVACGGTALTIQDLKASTKDVDFLVPVGGEYQILIRTIKKLGYKQMTGTGWARDEDFTFDLFPGKTVYVTELLESPLKKGNHIVIKKYKKITVSALNDYDWVISKMFRGSAVDFEDCLALIQSRDGFKIKVLIERYKETASYDVSEERVLKNLEPLLRRMNEAKNERKK